MEHSHGETCVFCFLASPNCLGERREHPKAPHHFSAPLACGRLGHTAAPDNNLSSIVSLEKLQSLCLLFGRGDLLWIVAGDATEGQNFFIELIANVSTGLLFASASGVASLQCAEAGPAVVQMG